VLLSHTNLVAGASLVSASQRPFYEQEAREGKPFDRRTLAHLPTAHIAGVMGYFVIPHFEGGLVYWMPGFNFDQFLAHCENLRINNFFTVPPIYMAIAKHPAVKDQFKLIRAATSGAAPLTGELQEQATKKMGSGYQVRQTWGMSETTGAATYCPAGEDVLMGSLGQLFPNILMRYA
jgi:4-coumarate--CoA ligase